MPITKQTGSRILVPLSYPATNPETGELLKDAGGSQIEDRCMLILRRRSNGEAENQARDATLGAASLVDQLAELILEPPVGFADFPLTRAEWEARNPGVEANGQAFAPDDSPLAERFKAYFGDDQMYLYADHFYAGYIQRAMPKELFRGF